MTPIFKLFNTQVDELVYIRYFEPEDIQEVVKYRQRPGSVYFGETFAEQQNTLGYSKNINLFLG